jgi:hypothetical protein
MNEEYQNFEFPEERELPLIEQEEESENLRHVEDCASPYGKLNPFQSLLKKDWK